MTVTTGKQSLHCCKGNHKPLLFIYYYLQARQMVKTDVNICTYIRTHTYVCVRVRVRARVCERERDNSIELRS